MATFVETTGPTIIGRVVPDPIRREIPTIAGRKKSSSRRGLTWILRMAVALPAASVSLIHVHETALHFGQSGGMGWAEAVGMEAVTALALMELDEDTRRRGPARDAALPWVLLISAVVMSLGSNVFAVLQQSGESRSFGGVVYGAWPTLAFLAVAWLWHRQARREVEQLAAEIDNEDQADEDAADIPDQRGSKRKAVESAVRLALENGHTPAPADIARQTGATAQYAGRIIKEMTQIP